MDVHTYADAIMGNKVQLVDVRTPREFNQGHIKNAINIDFYDSTNFERSFGKLDKGKPVYIYCRSGARSQKAAKKLLDMGFSKIFDLKRGYMGWK
ncbi:rhodanese-like domain-containing protein [Pelagihabitans pacificus]|uniref:rhodanese-like domain-containing protein n=1 Tax=Pelagihabitans pacificus TaxID=2696054 RepID=UPI00293BC800|nr:rhodanese-like domain-containing protein [Pelagihabitans pacificus]